MDNQDVLWIQLFVELIQYPKDLDCTNKFLNLIDRKNANKSRELLSKLPLSIQSQFEKLTSQPTRSTPKTPDNSTYYFPAASELSMENIVFVDTNDKFESFLNDFAVVTDNLNDVIGLDSEWKPSFGITGEPQNAIGNNVNGASVLQISTRKQTYIIDMLFMQTVDDELMNRFAESVLYSNKIIKLG